MTTDLSTRILIEIRDGIGKMGDTLNQTVERLDQTVERLDQTVERLDRLERRQVETEVWMRTAMNEQTLFLRQISAHLKSGRKLERAMNDHEARISALESKVG